MVHSVSILRLGFWGVKNGIGVALGCVARLAKPGIGARWRKAQPACLSPIR